MAERFCCDCNHLNRDKYYRGIFDSETKYYCEVCYEYKKLTDKECYKFREIQHCDNSYTPSGCFITTLVCDILGYEDNCELLNTLRVFRDSILKPNPKYLPLLLEYDIVGPIICNHLRNDIDKKSIALKISQFFLIPCVQEIKNGNIENAVIIYRNMVEKFKEDYKIQTPIIKVDNSINLETLGKGRIRHPKTSEA